MKAGPWGVKRFTQEGLALVMRGPGESYSDVILRLASEADEPGGTKMTNRHVGLELCIAVGFLAASARASAETLTCSTTKGAGCAPRRAATGRWRRNGWA